VPVAEAARLLSVSRSFVYTAMERGHLLYVKLGRARRIPRRALTEYVAARLRGGTRP
jgi:excisionase family DNA binding protein